MSDPIASEQFSKTLADLLRETFEKVDGIYLDRGTSLFETLDLLTPEQASSPPVEGGTTIAGHVYHIRFYLQVLRDYIQGKWHEKLDWKQSWIVKSCSHDEWTGLRQQMRDEYAVLTAFLQGINNWTDESLGGALAIVGHTAYHLGAIRQMLRVVAM